MTAERPTRGDAHLGNGSMPRPVPVGYVLRKFPVLSETFVLSELLGLERRGVPLHVFSMMRPNDPRFHDDLPSLKARVAYVPEVGNLRKLIGHNRRLAKRASRGYREALLQVLATGRPELLWRLLQAGYVANESLRLGLRHLHAQFANRPTTVARLAARAAGIPFSFTAHATDIFKHRVDQRALRAKIDDARFVVTVSEFNRRYLQDVAPGCPDRIVNVPNGIDMDRFAPTEPPAWRPFRILAVARLVEKKGLEYLVDACRILRDDGLDFRCRIVGKGRLRSPLGRRIREAGLQNHVDLVGPRTQLEVREEYRQAHVYVLPAIVGSDGNREGLPVSIVEALACGLPVVSTPVTGIPEVVRNDQNGLLVAPRDAAAVARALGSIGNDVSLWARLRQGARPSVDPVFDRDATLAQLHRLIEEAALS